MTYKTKAGSLVMVDGRSYVISFDWFEEPNACVECKMPDYDMHYNELSWYCDYCDGGYAKLVEVENG